MAQAEHGSIRENGRPIEGLAIEFKRLERLDQVILALPPENQRSTAQVSTNRQIDIVSGIRLPQGDLLAIAQGKTTHTINPQDPRPGHRFLRAKGGIRKSNPSYHTVLLPCGEANRLSGKPPGSR
jgi:DNA-binding transcriptional regulator LsrR (DeoR family)